LREGGKISLIAYRKNRKLTNFTFFFGEELISPEGKHFHQFTCFGKGNEPKQRLHIGVMPRGDFHSINVMSPRFPLKIQSYNILLKT